jgi:hypothetical protein
VEGVAAVVPEVGVEREQHAAGPCSDAKNAGICSALGSDRQRSNIDLSGTHLRNDAGRNLLIRKELELFALEAGVSPQLIGDLEPLGVSS